jgi:hypothetical protein
MAKDDRLKLVEHGIVLAEWDGQRGKGFVRVKGYPRGKEYEFKSFAAWTRKVRSLYGRKRLRKF